jgi:uroporphyrin-III C-methyltransferase / precorrin-2 dehydrogenase / sirohydrochlorin ferrochelatase
MSGRVALVGAGPGDAGLLTRRAVALLRRADLVLYDALVSEAIVGIARRARRFYVGKRRGRHQMSQEAINRLMIRGAARGRRVVRLKGGDPFLFGRGGEEALALRAAGVTVDVVPGVSAALAAPAMAGVPVTHRGISTAVLIVSGHAEPAYAPVIDGLTPQSATLIVLMGLAERRAIAARLIDRGWSGATPAAIVFGAGHPGQCAWSGRLDALGDTAIRGDLPGTMVVGAVVALAPLIGSAVPLVDAGRPVARLKFQRRG